MPVRPTYPGVYIEEVPSAVRTIVGVATSIAAFIDAFPRGPLNAAVKLFSMGDFEREFGGLDPQSEAAYGVQQFFLNGGSEAWVVRVAANNPVAASAVLGDAPAGGGTPILRVRAGRQLRGASVDNPGEWGNFLRIEVDYDTTNVGEFFNLTVSEVEIEGGRAVIRRTETFRNLTMRPNTPNNAIQSVNEGSTLVQLSRDAGWGAIP